MEGFDASIERAGAYIDAGADVTFVEAPQSLEEIRRIPQLLGVPQLVNMVIGGNTPPVPQKELAAMGFGITLYANAALQGAVRGMRAAFERLLVDGVLHEDPRLVASFDERQRLVNKARFDALDARYAAPREAPKG